MVALERGVVFEERAAGLYPKEYIMGVMRAIKALYDVVVWSGRSRDRYFDDLPRLGVAIFPRNDSGGES